MISVFTKSHCQDQLIKFKNQLQKESRSFQQILSTQQDYVNFLYFTTEEFKIILSKKLGLGEDLYQQLFRGIDRIYELHRQILEGLQKITTAKNKSQGLSQHFDKYIPYLKIYQEYFDTLQYRRQLVDQIKEKEKLNNYSKVMRSYVEDIKGKYPQTFLNYICRVELIDCLSKPFQRYHQYELLLNNYINLQRPNSSFLKEIKCTVAFLKTQINKINQNLRNTNQQTVKSLEKKYGNLMKYHVIFYQSMVVNWYHRSKLENGRLYIFDKVLLITSLDNREKELKRIILGEHSYFHHLNVGRNFPTQIFIKGLDGHMTLFIQAQSFQSLIKIIQNLIGHAEFRKSWEKDILKKPLNFQQNAIIFRPISLSKHNYKYRYGITFQIEGTNKVIRSFFTINQLKNIAQEMIQNGHQTESLQEATGVDLEGEIDEYYAQQLTLGLFQYLSPLLHNFLALQSNPRLQTLLKLDEYIKWYLQKQKEQQKVYYNSLFSSQEDRLRLKYQNYQKGSFVQISIWVTYDRLIKIRIGKNERIYQIVRKIISIDSFSFDFTLFIGQNQGILRLLDDDQILYQVMKQDGFTFPEERGFIMKGINLLIGKQQPNVYLKKYLYLETFIPDLCENQSKERLYFLANDIAQKILKVRHNINIYKMIQIISLILTIVTNELKPEHQKLAQKAWKTLFNQNYDFSFMDFKRQIMEMFMRKVQNGPLTNYLILLSEVEYYRWYSYHIIGRIQQKLVYVFVKLECIQVRSWQDFQILIFRIPHKDLVYSVAPSNIKIRAPDQDYILDVDDVYGLVLVLQRNLNVSRFAVI